MKLFEEFKEYENLWETAPTNVHAPFEWSIGPKTYNIIDYTDLRAYIEDAAHNELTTNATKYANELGDDKVFMAYHNVFSELITFYENQEPKNKAFINRLNVLRDRYLNDLHRSYDQKNLQQDIADIADTCLRQFTNEVEKLSPNFKRNITEPGRQSDLDMIKEELIRLGMALVHSNSITEEAGNTSTEEIPSDNKYILAFAFYDYGQYWKAIDENEDGSTCVTTHRSDGKFYKDTVYTGKLYDSIEACIAEVNRNPEKYLPYTLPEKIDYVSGRKNGSIGIIELNDTFDGYADITPIFNCKARKLVPAKN